MQFMKIRALNNATTLISTPCHNLLLDPWLIGDLYYGSWSPYASVKDLTFLQDVDSIFISHIHEDHWDLDTLSLLNRKKPIYIPQMRVNNVIELKLKKLGFENIMQVGILEDFEISENLTLRIIPPLNSFGQELGRYIDGYESNATNIDTGLLVSDNISKTSHCFLFDNSPYDIKLLASSIGDKKISSFWYPHNGYAQDYPLCYENIDSALKEKIHNQMIQKRIDVVKQSIDLIRPDVYLPHSADFVINGQISKNFNLFAKKDFLDRYQTSQKYDFKDINASSDYLNYGDEMIIDHSGYSIDRNVYEFNLNKSDISYSARFNSSMVSIEDLKISFENMLRRSRSYGVKLELLQTWAISIITNSLDIHFSFKNGVIKESDLDKYKLLSIKLNDSQLSALLNREIHFNNASIGCLFSYTREPNEYCQEVYSSLNFFHL